MNIVYLHAHDAGRYIQPYGHAIPTPNLMRLARQSTLFRHAYCAAPTCSPSRAALLTGVSAHESGMLGLAHRGFSLTHPERHLGSFLRENGYQTVLSGVQHEFAWDESLPPYDRQLKLPETEGHAARDRAAAEAAAAFLREEHESPFFLSCGFIFPHRAFTEIDPDIDPAYVQPPAGLPDQAEIRRDMAAYHTAVRHMDRAAGKVIRTLKETGLDQSTLLIFTVDHGIAFPGMKCQLCDNGIGISLIIHYPGNPTAGRATDALVSQLDLYPTICDLAGLAPPSWLSGHSLRPILEGRAGSVRDEVFAEVTFHAGYEPQRAIRTRTHKLIRIFDDDLTPVMVNIDDSPSKTLLHQHGFPNRVPVQLYDLLLDPEERNNLAGNPAHAAIESDLTARLQAWMEATRDPLLEGAVPPPAGARINLRSQYSPNEPLA
ncbi:MAG: sulfatase [Opitutaceae bacterium]